MTQVKASDFNKLLGIKDSYEAPSKLMQILYDRESREKLMREFLIATNHQVDDDTFRHYFEGEHADRKEKKQDFTPTSVSKLTRKLIGDTKGSFYEGCAGTGSMTIAAWNEDRMQHSPFDYKPSFYFYHVEELSDRAIPFLIFNLALRGMNATVVHCDVLSRQAYGVFFIQNDRDDHLCFSSINCFPYNETIEKEFGITFVEEKYKPLIESPKDLHHLVNTPKKEISPETLFIYGLCGVNIAHQKEYSGINSTEVLVEHKIEQLTLFD